MNLNPYLNFSGNAKEAMEFYRSVLGGELSIQTFGEAKAAKSPEDEHRTMHAQLKGDGVLIFASDTMPGTQANFGNSVHLCLQGQEKDRLTGIFAKLSEGGTVAMPLAEQFWGDTFGMLTDKFGIHWMVNIAKEK